MFCVECGKEGKVYNNLCEECFLKRTKVVEMPQIIDIKMCVHCGAWHKKRWSQDDDFLTKVVSESLKFHKDVREQGFELSQFWEDYSNIRLIAHVHGTVKGLSFEKELSTRLRIKRGVCNRCSKRFGDYYESIIQFRARGRGVDKDELESAKQIVRQVLERSKSSDPKAFSSKEELIHGGIDFYIGSISVGRTIAKTLAETFSGRCTESSKLVGRKEGKDVYRITFAVRIPSYRADDFLLIGNKVYQVSEMHKDKATLIDLETWERVQIKHRELEDAKVLGNKDMVKESVIVSKSEYEVQVLDPETYRTVELTKPKGFNADRDTLRVVRLNESIYLLPENGKRMRK